MPASQVPGHCVGGKTFKDLLKGVYNSTSVSHLTQLLMFKFGFIKWNLIKALKLNYKPSKMTNSLTLKWENYFNTHFTQEDLRIHKYMKTCSTSLMVREIQSRTAVRCNKPPTRMLTIRNMDNSKCGQGCGETGTFLHHWWEHKIGQTLWKCLEISFKS